MRQEGGGGLEEREGEWVSGDSARTGAASPKQKKTKREIQAEAQHGPWTAHEYVCV